MVLQVRVDPSKIKIARETLLKGREIQIDPNFKNDELEWLVEVPEKTIMPGQDNKRFKQGVSNVHMGEGIVVYGIMIRETDKNPEDIKELTKWW